jgi:hypothetical protein
VGEDPRVLPSIGALMVTMHESVLDELNGAEIKLKSFKFVVSIRRAFKA